MIRNNSTAHNSDIYPTLQEILDVKSSCYPENLHVLETSAEVPLQDMVNHTLQRILQLNEKKLSEFGKGKEGVFYMKCVFDGASSQSVYKKFYDTELEEGINE